MPVTITEVSKAVNGKPSLEKQEIEIACENPNCQRGLTPEGRPSPSILVVDGMKPEETPDRLYETLYLVNYNNDRFTFCGKGCAQSFLLTYRPIKSPNQGNVVEFKKED